jgi:photosystem II stability/assembly factor-like uncharacterized protein
VSNLATIGKRVTALLKSLLLLSVFLSLFCYVNPVSASPEPLRWTGVNIPAGGEAGNWVLASGSDIRHLAAATDGTLYASVQGLTYTLYRSTDGGVSWAYIGNARDTIIDIAVSPRDSKKIYYATTSAVYRSVNSGRTFAAMPANPGGAGTGHKEITSLDVTSLNDSIVAVSIRDTDRTKYGGVYILDETNIIPSWVNAEVGNYDVYTVSFSPNYASDRQLIAVTTDETDTFIVSKTGESGWNAVSGRARLNRDNTIPFTPIALAGSATIAFPRNYNADPDSGSSFLYAGIATGTGAGDVYKISFAAAPTPSTATDLNSGQKYGLNNIDISGLTAPGNYPAGALIAGEAGSSRIYYTTDGGVNWTKARKEPSGDAVTCLLSLPDTASNGRIYAATSGANSGLSLTRDTGATWNQLSLIDTTIDTIVDLAPSPRYAADNTLFMLTFGGRNSLWRSRDSGNTWERILNGNSGGVDTLKFVGLPPQYGNESRTIFAAGESNGQPAVWQSTDDGQSYRCRLTHEPATGVSFPIDAWAIADDTSFFIGGSDGSHSMIYFTTNSGFVYNDGTPAGIQSLNSLAISPFYQQDGTILAGNTNGWVYLSTDKGASFQPLPRDSTSPPLAGSVSVAFDPRFNKNHTVYAAGDNTAGGIRRFTIPTSREWLNIDATLPAAATINQLAIGSEGTLYGANSGANGGMERCLSPASTTSTEFETVTRYLPSGATLSGIWVCDHHIWAADTVSARLLTFHDTLTAPAAQSSPVNKAAGIGSLNDHTVRNIFIDWGTLEGATSYQWQCDYSSEFASVPTTLEGTISASSVRLPALEPATNYHWRVRASAPILSPWSDKWSFTTGLDTEVITLKPESPSAGANGVPVKPAFQWTAITGAATYELLVAANADFDHPAIIRTEKYSLPSNVWQSDVSLDYQTTYYWKVRAISSGTSSVWSSTGVFITEPAPVKPAEPPALPALSPVNPLDMISPSSTAIATAPLPTASSQAQIKPAPSSLPPQDISALPSFSQSFNLPAWIIYFIMGLLATVFMALVVILAIVLRIRRF